MKLAIMLALALISLAGCRKTRPCAPLDPDAGTSIPATCAGEEDGAPCCLGAVEGKCRSSRCAAN